MSRIVKTMMSDDIHARLEGVDGGVFVSTQGLNSELTYDFRRALHARNLQYMVVRNSLARIAFEKRGYKRAKLEKVLKGVIGMVYSTEEASGPAASRAIEEWKREKRDKVVEWKGAFVDGDVLGPQEAQLLKDAPTKEQARAMLLGTLQAPIVRLLATIREPHARIVYVLNKYQEKRSDGGDAAAS
ncbi:MAG: 50S ribosomal protein L10 [Planctomycetota bacterium]